MCIARWIDLVALLADQKRCCDGHRDVPFL